MSRSVCVAVYRVFGNELSELLDTVLAGEVVSDRDTAERLVRSVGALVDLHNLHRIDRRGRCGLCWPVQRRWWWPWSRRSTCTVHTALSFHLRQPSKFVLTTLTEARPVSPSVAREAP